MAVSCDNTKSVKPLKATNEDGKSPTRFAVNYDLDNNNIIDSFQISGEYSNEIENLNIWLNKNKFTFSVEEVSFDKFTNKNILNKNLIQNNHFLFLQLTPTQKGLLMRDRGDFAGEAHYLYTYEKNQIKRIWFDQESLIEINDLDRDSKVEFVTETSEGEPGFKNGYDFVEYTLFKVFSVKKLAPELDTALSYKYNLAHKAGFAKSLLMRSPVMAKETTESEGKYRLLDLENLPK